MIDRIGSKYDLKPMAFGKRQAGKLTASIKFAVEMSVKALIALLFSLFSVLSAHADSPSGRELNRMMQYSEGHHSDGGDFQAGRYEGYIMGVSDGLIGTSLYYYCPPAKIGKNQLRGVVSHYLKTHPQDLHVPAGALVAAALIEAFPCQKKSQDPDWRELD